MSPPNSINFSKVAKALKSIGSVVDSLYSPLEYIMQKEIWKPVVGYEGYYEVSSFGNVRSLDRPVKVKGGLRVAKGRPKSFYCDKGGYFQVRLSKNCKSKTVHVHKLVQSAFLLGEGIIDHIDRDKKNNNILNLRIVTTRENAWNTKANANLIGARYCNYKGVKKWRSSVNFKGKDTHIGYFHTELEAHNAYIEFLNKNGISTEKMYI